MAHTSTSTPRRCASRSRRSSSAARTEVVEAVDLGAIAPAIAAGRSMLRVDTSPGDDVVFARRPGRAGPTRFVRGRTPTPTTLLTVVVGRLPRGDHKLRTAFWGSPAAREPWDRHATPEDAAFWATHQGIVGPSP